MTILRTATGLVTVGALLSMSLPAMARDHAPRVLKWHEGDPIVAGYHPATRPRFGLVTAGVITFAVPYAFSAVIAAAHNVSEGTVWSCCNWLWVPLVGPFLQMGQWKPNTPENDKLVGNVLLALDGMLQVGGAVMLTLGFALPKAVLVQNDDVEAHVTPMIGPNTAGLAIAGHF